MKLVKSTLLVLALCCFQAMAFGQCEDDTTPPVITVPDDITIDCDEDWPPIPPVICWDDCDLSIIPTFTFWYVDNKCGFQSQILLWAATDQAGNSTSATMVVEKCDLSAPVLSGCPEDLELECGDEIPEPAEVTATDNCSEFSIEYEETIEDLGTCPGEMVITRTWTATDIYDNSSSCSHTITITDNTPPTIDSYNDGEALADITVSCDDIPGQYTANTSDNCDEDPDIIFTEKILPGSCADSYQIYRSYLAVDACGHTSALDEHTITVIDDEAPTLLVQDCEWQSIGNATHQDFDPTDGELMAYLSSGGINPTSESVADALGISVTELDVNGTSASPSYGAAVYQEITVSAGDVLSFDWRWQSFESPGFFNDYAYILLIEDGVVLLASTVATGGSGTLTPWDTFSHTFVNPGTCYLAIGVFDVADNAVDSNLSLDNVQISGGINDGSFESGEFNSDGVCDSLYSNATVDCDNIPEIPADPEALDNCDNDVEIEFTETTTGWAQCQYFIYRTWTATDNCGNSTSHTQTITVEDTYAPELSSTPGDLTLECDDPIPAPATITATDMCDGTVAVDFDTYSKGDGCSSTIVRTWSASDACGNSSSHTQTITILDTTSPTITHNLDLNIDAECDNIPAAGSISSTDNCGGTTNSLSEVILDGECEDSYTILRLYIAFDECGNSSSVTQTINVSDNTAPTFDELPQDHFIDCPELGGGAPDDISASDNCDNDVSVGYYDSPAGSCSFTRTWYAQDNCGNTTYASQLLSYNDDTPPVLSGLPENTSASCDNIPEPAEVSASDECSTAFLAFDEKNLPGTCPNEYTILRTWTGLDACGNTSTHTQIIEVYDNENPTFDQESLPQNLILSCDLPLPAQATLTASDNCGSATVTPYESFTGNNCYGLYTRTWVASDLCGNSISHTQYIEIYDDEAPAFNYDGNHSQVDCIDGCQLLDLTVECDAIPAPWEPTANDNCGSVSISFSESEVTSEDCPNESTITRTWTATDNCGNSTTEVQTITVVDTTPPSFSNTPADMEIMYCNEPWPEPESPAVADNCDAQPTLTFEQEILTNQEIATDVNGDILTRIWTTSDNCGNTDTYTQTIYLVDDCPSNGCVSLYNFHDAPESVSIDMLPTKVKFNWNVPENAVKAQAKITSALGTNWYLIHNLNFPKKVNHGFFVAGVEYTVQIRYFSQYNPCKISSKWSDGATFIIPGSSAIAQNDGNPFDDDKEVKRTTENFDNHLHIYPNPNNGEFFIVTDLRDYSIEIFDLSGRLVSNLGEFNNEQSHIELGSYTPGIYMVRIFNDSQTLTERVILK